MKKCPYCNKEFKEITANHLKTHGVTYKEYLREYDKEKYYEKVVVDFIEEYYKPSRKRFIEQILFKETKTFGWITIDTTTRAKYDLLKASATKKVEEEEQRTGKKVEVEMQKNLRKFPFCRQDLVAHIRQARTVGIHTMRENTSCFMTFDIDVYDEEVLQKIWETLNIFEIEDEQVLASYSGNKGCHLTIFFDEFIDNSIIQAFFNLIFYEANIDKEERENGAPVVELRGAGKQGVKLPFGLNRKNSVPYKKIMSYDDYEETEKRGKGNYCYLINKFMGEIDTITKLESMQKVSKTTIEQIVADYEEFEPVTDVVTNVKELNVSHVDKGFTDLVDDIDISKVTNSKEDIEGSIEKLLTRPIIQGTRHDTLFKIAVYNKSKSMSVEENEEFLLKFSTQDRHEYKATAKENKADIKSLIKTIYFSKNSDMYRIKATIKEIFFSREDIEEILSIKNKSLRKVYFVLILHIKLYHSFKSKEDENIQFYCGYERLQAALKIDCKTINDRLKILQELDKINFIRKGEYEQKIFTKEEREQKSIDERKKEIRKLPNIYQLNYKMQDVKEGYKLLCSAKKEEDNITYVNFQMMCAKVLTKKEIAQYFTGVEAIDVSKYKYQQTRAIG